LPSHGIARQDAPGHGGEQMSPGRAIGFGALTVAVLDGLDAIVFFGLRGASPIRIFQGIAAGLLGRQAAIQGGLATALLGVVLHFVVAFGIVSTYYAASRKIRVLTTHPLMCGAIYGVLVYFFMNQVVIPLSAIGRGSSPSLPVFLNGIFIHIFGVGLPTAYFVKAAR
jgi:hypothetical protein